MSQVQHIISRISSLLVAFVLLLPAAAAAQSSAEPQAVAADASADAGTIAEPLPVISLLTVGPGSKIYQLEGHTALRLNYGSDADITVNWGMFDFAAPNFIYRFVKGETDYRIGISPMQYTMIEYAYQGRSIVEQTLNLTDAEKREVIRLIQENLLPENQVYRYNYVKDNCATRPLAIIEKAIRADSAALYFNMPHVETTFRREMRQYHSEHPFYQLGIDIALGSGIDKPIGPREQAFAPIYLDDLAASAYIVGSDNAERPLVESTSTLLAESPTMQSNDKAIWWIIFCAWLAAVVATTAIDLLRRKSSRWFDVVLFSIYGIGGIVITFLVFVSSHEATSPNLNLFWINPLALIVPIMIWSKKTRNLLFYYHEVNAVLVATFLLGIPFYAQSVSWMTVALATAPLLRSISYVINQRNK